MSAGLLLPLVACGQRALLSTDDYVEIRQLTARYAQALDSGTDDGHALAGLFVDDGESIRPDARGRDALAAAVLHPLRGPAHVAHFTFNHVIEPADDGGADGWQYVAEFRFDDNRPSPAGNAGNRQNRQPVDQRSLVGRPGGQLVSIGRYRDAYVKTEEGWRFRRREYVPVSAADDRTARPAPPAAGVEQWDAGASAPRSVPLAPIDYFDIEQLVASYGHALDSGFGSEDNGEVYASLFTPGGVFYSRGRPMRGPAALATIARAQPHGPHYARHFLANPVIDSSGGAVTGRQYLTVIDIGDGDVPTTVYLGGYYEDVYQKTYAGWRFEERRSFGARTGPASGPATDAGTQPARPANPSSRQLPAEQPRATLAAVERSAIHQLVARYSYAMDDATENGDRLARLFLPDGVLVVPDATVAGRAALAGFARERRTRMATLVTNVFLEGDGDRATGRVYILEVRGDDPDGVGTLSTGGLFLDRYQRTAEGWRFARREFTRSRLPDSR